RMSKSDAFFTIFNALWKVPPEELKPKSLSDDTTPGNTPLDGAPFKALTVEQMLDLITADLDNTLTREKREAKNNKLLEDKKYTERLRTFETLRDLIRRELSTYLQELESQRANLEAAPRESVQNIKTLTLLCAEINRGNYQQADQLASTLPSLRE